MGREWPVLPVYAFNEYLQLTVEGGVVLLLLACAFIYYTFSERLSNEAIWYMWRAVIFMCFLHFSAYPLSVFPFGVVGILLASLCVSNGKEEERRCFSEVLLRILYPFSYLLFLYLVFIS